MDLARAFSADYVSARTRFRDAAARLGFQQEAIAVEGAGPQGEELTIDVATSPAPADAPTLVLSSGLHGVEGLMGSAAQLALLEQWAHSPLPPVRCLFLHALNPHAFAWLRRFDENNVDLNRNFLLPGQKYAGGHEAYARLHPLLNLRRPPSRWEPFRIKAALAILRFGAATLRQAIAGGQYDYPRGIFYGGSGPSNLYRLLEAHLDRWLGNGRRVVHLDFHTALGPWGGGKLLIGYPATPTQRENLAAWFGPDSFAECAGDKELYTARGDFGAWCVARYPQRDYLFACAEFGTYGPLRVLSALRAENQAHHYCRPGDPVAVRVKRRFVETFCPASPRWRRRVIETSLRYAEQAIAGLTQEPTQPAPPFRARIAAA